MSDLSQHSHRIDLSRLFQESDFSHPVLELTSVEALIAISVLAIAADGELSEHEQQTLFTTYIRFFAKNTVEQYYLFLDHVLNLIQNYNASDVFLAAKKILTPLLKETAFAIATDLVLSDGIFTHEEKQFLLQLWNALEIPDESGQKIIDVMVTKNCRFKLIENDHFVP